MVDTIIKQYSKKPVREYKSDFYSYVFMILNNLIKTDLDKNTKLLLISYLISERSIVFFKNEENNLQIARLSRCITRDENLLPVDISVRTLNGTNYELIKGNYVIMYNTIPIDYLKTKIEEISNIEKTTNHLRKLYKTPIIFQAHDSKPLKAIRDFIKKIFTVDEDELCVITNDGWNVEKQVQKLDLNIPYITDKLLDENESLKEDILEILGIYKNTSSTRERVNETELIVSNSLTTVNKLGLEDLLNETFKEIREKLKFDYSIELNINKIFDTMKGGAE